MRTKTEQPKLSLQDRLMLEANRLKGDANRLPHGPLREAMIRAAGLTETAHRIEGWLSAASLRAPT
jgi:hypothetical protein